MYWNYCTSSNREDIIPGMIIAVPSHTGTYLGSIYGHVGIIVTHDGQYWVRQDVGPITEVSLDEWIVEYGDTYEPRWGFAAQIQECDYISTKDKILTGILIIVVVMLVMFSMLPNATFGETLYSATTTMVAYNTSLEGREYLQEGYPN